MEVKGSLVFAKMALNGFSIKTNFARGCSVEMRFAAERIAFLTFLV